MEIRYDHHYGGKAFNMGEWTPEQVEDFIWERSHQHVNMRGVAHEHGKVLDIMIKGKEILGYPTRSGKIRLECINYA